MKVSNNEQADPRPVALAGAGLLRLPLRRRRRWRLWPRRGCRRRSVARKRPLSGGRGGDAGLSVLVVECGAQAEDLPPRRRGQRGRDGQPERPLSRCPSAST